MLVDWNEGDCCWRGGRPRTGRGVEPKNDCLDDDEDGVALNEKGAAVEDGPKLNDDGVPPNENALPCLGV